MYTILYWTFHVHGFVHDFMRVLWYCVILHDVTFALKALYFNGIDIVWHAMIKKLLVPITLFLFHTITYQKLIHISCFYLFQTSHFE